MPKDNDKNLLHLTIAALSSVIISVTLLLLHPKTKKKFKTVKKRTLTELVRPNILSLAPYRCARDDFDKGMLLDANENTLGPAISDSLLNLDASLLELNRYPDPYQLKLKGHLAKFRNVKEEQIFVGVGSDEAIDLLIRIFCVPDRDSILITPPTYGMYKICAKTNGVAIQTSILNPDFSLNLNSVKETIDSTTKVIFLCSPGNPTAVCIPLQTIISLHDSFDGIIVVDEAYIDFAPIPSACTLLNSLDRLVVTQTLSKAFGLAGIRLGFACSSSFIISLMNKVKAPYNVNKLSSEVACRGFSDLSKYKKNVGRILSQRDKLMETFRKERYVKRVLKSQANFFLLEVENAHTIYLHMANEGVVVRFRGNEFHCKNCLRITVGSEEENEKLLAKVRETVGLIETGKIPLRE